MINTPPRFRVPHQSTMNVGNIPPTGNVHSRLEPAYYDGGCRQGLHILSHHRERRAGIRSARTSCYSQTRTRKPGRHNLLFALIIIISFCCSFTMAIPRPFIDDYPERITDPLASLSEDQRSAIDISEPLLLDLRPPPPSVAWQYSYNGEVLEGPEDPYLEDSYKVRRQADKTQSTTSSKEHSSSTTAEIHSSATDKSSSSARSASATTQSSSTSTTPSTTSSGSLAVATTDSSTPLPSPFDSSLGNNFTVAACPAFIQSFLAEPQFKACLPFSLLLENSNSFFQAEKSIVRITQVLDATCAATSSTCTSYLGSLAVNLTSSANCKADYEAQNPTVLQARIGLLAYQPLYSASCLKNSKTNAYCFADAITNASSPTDSYIYYLPLNMSLPGSSQPTCNSCLQNTMAVFNSAAANRTQAIANTYSAAAAQINVQCGPGFVTASIPASSGGAMVNSINSHVGLLALMIFVITLLR